MPAEAAFERLITSIAQHQSFDIRLFDDRRKDRSNQLPTDARKLVAGHIAEIFFYRQDLLDQFLRLRRGFLLYTTPQAYKDDGGVAGGCYNPQRDAIQLVMSRLYEGFNAPTPGVAPFIHEFGHMLDHATGNRGLIPGMDGVIDLFRRGKQLELKRYQQFQIGRGDTVPIGHPYVFQNDGEFIAGYLEMFFRNPHYFAAQNSDLFQAFAQCLGQDPRQYWKVDFPYYVQQNRDYYLKSGQRPPRPGITIP
ncbi:MAG TPA: zinc-dependent peptidase [Phototrophicaceae bacterium]|nr:zinc-dependent peptidase [Phototrophicaceae bacterium]